MVLLEEQTGTLLAETLVGVIIQIVGAKLEVIVVGHIHRRGGVRHMLEVACLLLVPEDPPVDTELALQIIPKVVSMEVLVLVLVGVLTKWVAVEINSMVGSHKRTQSYLCWAMLLA